MKCQLAIAVWAVLVLGHYLAAKAFNSSSLVGFLNWEAHTAHEGHLLQNTAQA